MDEATDTVEVFARDLVRACPHIEREASVRNLEVLAGDISTRQYIRVFLTGSKSESVMLMRLSGQMGPVGGGKRGSSQDDTFVELQSFLAAHDIPVPKILLDARKQQALLVEDVGDLALWNIATGEVQLEDEKGYSDALSVSAEGYFRKAIELIGRLQRIPPDPDCVRLFS